MSRELLSEMVLFTEHFISYLDSLEDLLSSNPIWLNRLQGVGQISKQNALGLGFTGPVLRGSGLP